MRPESAAARSGASAAYPKGPTFPRPVPVVSGSLTVRPDNSHRLARANGCSIKSRRVRISSGAIQS
jgi:hypothetical protein